MLTPKVIEITRLSAHRDVALVRPPRTGSGVLHSAAHLSTGGVRGGRDFLRAEA